MDNLIRMYQHTKDKMFISIMLLALSPIICVGQINVNVDPQIDRLSEQYRSLNSESEFFEGFRVQIISSDDRRKVDNTKYSFGREYPQYKLISRFSNPYYKLQIGAFATKLEAERIRHIIRDDYPRAYVIKDKEIDPFELFE